MHAVTGGEPLNKIGDVFGGRYIWCGCASSRNVWRTTAGGEKGDGKKEEGDKNRTDAAIVK